MSAGSRGRSGRSVRTKTTPWSSGAGWTFSVQDAPVCSPTPDSENGSRMVLCLRVKASDAPSAVRRCKASGDRSLLLFARLLRLVADLPRLLAGLLRFLGLRGVHR